MYRLTAVLVLASIAASAQVGAWKKSVVKNKIDDSTTTVFSLASTDRGAHLLIRCNAGVTFGDGHIGTDTELYLASSKLLEESDGMRLRVDGGDPISKDVTISTDYRAAFVMQDDQTGQRFEKIIPVIVRAKKVLVEVGIFQAKPHTYEFRPFGLNLEAVSKACDLPPVQSAQK